MEETPLLVSDYYEHEIVKQYPSTHTDLIFVLMTAEI